MIMIFVAPLQADANVQNWGAPSLGLMRIVAYLKAHLRSRNIEYFIYDEQIDIKTEGFTTYVLEKWKNEKVEFLGISVLHYTIVRTFEFVRRWRELHPETFIFVGGNEAAANYQDIFDKCPIDAAVLAEGEETTLELVRWKLGEIRLEDISGIVYRKFAKPIDDEKFWSYWESVDFSEFRYRDYWKRTADLFGKPNYEEIYCVRLTPSSHCQRNCTFCSLAFVRNIACNTAAKPASLQGWQIMELVHRIRRQLPETRTIYFCNDDIFYPNRKYFEDFVGLYEESGYDYRFLVQTSTYCLKESDFSLLKRLGCQHISLGVENASEKVRRSLRKPQDSGKIERIIEWSHKYNIPVYFLIILIPPDSTMEDLWLNYETINHWMDAGVGVSIMPVVYAYRGMPLFEDNKYRLLYQTKPIAGTKLIYNDPHYVLPNDPIVRRLTREFMERQEEYVDEAYRRRDNKLKFKGGTSGILLQLLGELLKEYDRNGIYRRLGN